MISEKRWKRAQEYEQGFWKSVADRAAAGSVDQLDFYQWRADQLRMRLESVGAGKLVDGSARILELGSGPVGVVGFLPAAEKVAVDPLNGFYASDEALTHLRAGDVRYLEASGEKVPLESESYDLVIIENCIDHVHDVERVMSEIRRLLTPDGMLYITVNGRCRLGYWVHRGLARLALDPGHPHTFTEKRFHARIESFGFHILDSEAASWSKAWVDDLKSDGLRAKMKALLLVSENLLSLTARKTAIGTGG